MRRVELDEDEAERLYHSGLSIGEIGEALSVGYWLVYRRLLKRGVRFRAARYGPAPLRRKHQAVLWDDGTWLREQYATKSITRIAEELGDITPKSIHCALRRLGIPITKAKHQSLANHTSPKAAAQRREKLGLRHSYLQRQLAWFLYHAGFTDIRQEEPFYTFNVDFYSPSQHLAFEADGSFHQIPAHQEHDQRRDKFLMARYGLPVLRFSTTEIRRLYRTVH